MAPAPTASGDLIDTDIKLAVQPIQIVLFEVYLQKIESRHDANFLSSLAASDIIVMATYGVALVTIGYCWVLYIGDRERVEVRRLHAEWIIYIMIFHIL